MWGFLAFSLHFFYTWNSSLFSDLFSFVLLVFYLAPKFHWFCEHSKAEQVSSYLAESLNKWPGWNLFKQMCDIHFMSFTFQTFLGILTVVWEVKKNFVSVLGGKSFYPRHGKGFKRGVACLPYFLNAVKIMQQWSRFYKEPEACFSSKLMYSSMFDFQKATPFPPLLSSGV